MKSELQQSKQEAHRTWTPNKVPTMTGVSMTRAPGGIISDREALVLMATHAL